MRKKLTSLIQLANITKDIHERLAIYTKILNTTEHAKYLYTNEIADIFYNRSLAHIEMCGKNFYKSAYSAAICHTRSAASDIKNAQIRYHRIADIQACNERMVEYRNTRLHIIDVKEHRIDASMSEFIKVSRLMIETSDIDSNFFSVDRNDTNPNKVDYSHFLEAFEDFDFQAFKADFQQPNKSEACLNPSGFWKKEILKRKQNELVLNEEQKIKKIPVLGAL